MKIVVVSGGFDPIHSGHIELFKKASSLGDMLIVGVNSDEWLRRKKGKEFMPLEERKKIIESIKWVDAVWEFDDSDDTACELLERVRDHYYKILPVVSNFQMSSTAEIWFANGGDRTKENIPEMSVPGISFVFGIGGDEKKNSSSWILEEWKSPKTDRPWGHYRILHEVPGTKVKELTVNPGASLSMQKHFKRNEHWIVSQGKCMIEQRNGIDQIHKQLHKHETIHIQQESWHRLYNPFSESCRIVEVQYGEECVEEDIERK
jgi:cytidyltransferase-like protein